MKIIGIVFLGIICFLGCKEDLKPTLSDDKMVDVLTDLHLAEAAMLTLNKRIKDSVYLVYYKQVFEIHDVKDSVFFKDLELIRKDPVWIAKIYEEVVINIEQMDVKKEKGTKEEDTPKIKK